MITPGPIPQPATIAADDPGSGSSGPWSKLGRLKAYLKQFIKPELDFWIVSGRKCLPIYSQFFRSVEKTRFIWAHSLEYERVLTEFGKQFDAPRSTAQQIAYLEQGWFSKPPPGFRSPATYPPVSYQEYVEQLGPFFGRIESLTGCKVVVCAHPKSDQAHTRAMFPGLDFSFDSTNQVVARARGVIGMSSTSVQYAVIHRKPLLLVTTPTLKESYIQDFIDGYSSELGAPQLVANDEVGLEQILTNWNVDESRYDRFMRQYVKPEQADRRRMWEIVFADLAAASA